MQRKIKKFSLLMLLFLWPLNVFALEKLDISNFLVDVTLKEDGSMHVKELIETKGEFSSFSRRLIYKNASLKANEPPLLTKDAIYNGTSLENISLGYLSLNDEITFDTFNKDFTKFTKAYYKEDAKEKDYVESSIQDGKDLTLFYSNEEGNAAFLIEYDINDVIVKHLDCEEFYWSFLRNNFDQDIPSFSLRFHFPNRLNTNTFKSFLHGDITSKTIILDTKTIQTNFNKLKKNTEVSVRFLFDKDVILSVSSAKQSGLNAYQDIILLEDEKLQIDKQKEEQTILITNVIMNFCKVFLVILFSFWGLFLLKFCRQKKTNEKKEGLSYPIAILSNFYFDGNHKNVFCLSVLELLEKGKITYNRDTLILKNRENLNYTEEMILDFLFEKVGKNNKLSLKEWHKYLTNNETAYRFKKIYNSWCLCVTKETEKCGFYEKNGLEIITSIFSLLIILFVLFASLYFKVSLVLPWISFLLTICFVFYAFTVRHKTMEGKRVMKEIQKIRNNLENDLKNIPKASYPYFYLYSYFWNENEKIFDNMSSFLSNKKILKRSELETLKKMYQLGKKLQYDFLLNSEITE